MDQIIIQGGYPLRGEVHISGAKNSALPILAAALLAEGKSILKNIPRVKDVDTMLKIISSLGAEITQRGDNIELNPTVKKSFASYEFVSTMRASICLLGPLLAKKGEVKILKNSFLNLFLSSLYCPILDFFKSLFTFKFCSAVKACLFNS